MLYYVLCNIITYIFNKHINLYIYINVSQDIYIYISQDLRIIFYINYCICIINYISITFFNLLFKYIYIYMLI